MKVIDLLNKIANGKEVPKKIKYEDDIYIHVDNYCYFCEETNKILSQNIYAEFSRLNDEIEIIEEEKKIEKLDITLETTANGNLHNYLMYDGKKYAVSMPYRILNDKLDEIIDKINEMENK